MAETGAAPGTASRAGAGGARGGGRAWAVLAALAVVAVAVHVFLEWLFFATKPSFLTTSHPLEKALVAGTAALPLLVAALGLVGASYLLDAATRGRRSSRWLALGRAVPAAVVAIVALLLLDNFTHTLLGFGIGTFSGPARHLYVPVLAALAVFAFRQVGHWQRGLAGSAVTRRLLYAAAALVLAYSLAAFLLQRSPVRPLAAADLQPLPGAPSRRPNILLLGSDGLNAAHLSLYGSSRPTTPFLEGFAREALVFDRAYPNAANTGGSIVSLLTGRPPTETGVYYPPDVLRGQAAYLHLPAALRRLGYRTAEVSVRWYADAVDLNLRDAFDEANLRFVGNSSTDRWLASLGPSGGYFLARMGERVWERLLQLFTRKPWSDPYQEVTTQRTLVLRDAERVDQLLAFVERAPGPWFLHVHLLGTHGPRFYPSTRRFSRGQQQDADWMADFYDDAIAGFDRHLEGVVGALRERGLLDQTVIVLYSDHGQNFVTSRRTPLVLRLPGGERAGRLGAVVQNLDVAPTLLTYLGVRPPAWMPGRSLLDPRLPPCGWVLGAVSDPRFHIQQGGWWVSVPRPPFYTLGSLSLVAGDRFFSLDLESGRLDVLPADEPATTGGRCPTPSPATAEAFLRDRLRAAGYDVSVVPRGGGKARVPGRGRS